MNKTNNKWELAIAIIIPLLIGGISAFLTKDATKAFETVNKPPLSPPSILFPIAWTILYILMGIASYLIYKNNNLYNERKRKSALIIYFIQLFFNFFWSIIFFNLKYYYFAFIWLIVMWLLIILLMIKAKDINKTAFYLLIPYLLWTTFAGYLNLGIAILN